MWTNLHKKNARLGLDSARSNHAAAVRPNDHFVAACNKAYVPPFAFNDEQLQTVLRHRAWRYVHHNVPCPQSWNYEAVNRAATKMALAGHTIDANAPEGQHDIQDKHLAAVRRAGGYMELQAAIAWRAWREGQPSTEVAVGLGVTPWMVRQSLRRLRAIATRLGFDVGRRIHNFAGGAYDQPIFQQASAHQ